MSAKVEVHLSSETQSELESVCRSQSVRAAVARRARILLLGGSARPNQLDRTCHCFEVCGETVARPV